MIDFAPEQIKVKKAIIKYAQKAGCSLVDVQGVGGAGKTLICNSAIQDMPGEWISLQAYTALEVVTRQELIVTGVKIYHMMAFTASASTLLGPHASTIHSYLNLRPYNNLNALHNSEFEQYHQSSDPVKVDLIIIDESSQVGEDLWVLIKKIKIGCIVTLGDRKHQVQPVKSKGVKFHKFADKAFNLEKNYRATGNLADAIASYRENKADKFFDWDKWVDGDSIQYITRSEAVKLVKKDYDDTTYIAEKNKTVDAFIDDVVGAKRALKPGMKLQALNSFYHWNKELDTNIKMVTNGEIYTLGHEVVEFPYGKYTDWRKYVRWYVDEFTGGLNIKRFQIVNNYMPFVPIFNGHKEAYDEQVLTRFRDMAKYRDKVYQKYSADSFKDVMKRGKTKEYKKLKSLFQARKRIGTGVAFLRYTWASTAYKSQGRTIPIVIVDFDDIRKARERYVAVSRTAKRLYIIKG